MASRISDEQALLIVSSCVNTLAEKFLYENALFYATPPSQTLVRSLAQRMIQRSMSCVREESDPHIIVAVMLYALRCLRFSVLHEVEDKLVIPVQVEQHSDLKGFNNGAGSTMQGVDAFGHDVEFVSGVEITENYRDSKRAITDVLINVSQNRLDIIFQVLEFAAKILAISKSRQGSGSRDVMTSSEGLISAIAPFIYRPYGTAHLSLRHKHHLVLIRPVLVFLLENFYDVALVANNTYAPTSGIGASVSGGGSDVYNSQSSKVMLRSILPCNSTETSLLRALSEVESSGSEPIPPPASPQPHSSKKAKINMSMSGTNLAGLVNAAVATPNRDWGIDSNVMAVESSAPDALSHTHGSSPQNGGNGSSQNNTPQLWSLMNPNANSNNGNGMNNSQQGGWEWQVLESLMRNRVAAFIKGKFEILQPREVRDTHNDRSSHSTRNTSRLKEKGYLQDKESRAASPGTRFAWGGGGAGVEAARANSDVDMDKGSSMSTRNSARKDAVTSRSVAGAIPTPVQNERKSASRLARHRAVSECRSLKQKIATFEASHSTRSNANSQRSIEMQAIYSRYKSLKREIRDNAATDIQRIARGAAVRRHLSVFANVISLGEKPITQGAVVNRVANSSRASPSHTSNNSTLSTPNTSASNELMISNSISMSQSAMAVSASANASTNNSTSSLVMEDVLRASRERDNNSNVVNVLSSLSFDAGLHMNQMTNVSQKYSTTNFSSTGTSGAGVSGGNASESSDSISHYRYLISQKRDLKRLLKKFDEDFETNHGRAPKKSDKEILRPQYQRYHDLKGDMSRLKAVIEREFGPDAVPVEDEINMNAQPQVTEKPKPTKPAKPERRSTRGNSPSPLNIESNNPRDAHSSSAGVHDMASVSPATAPINDTTPVNSSAVGEISCGAAYPHIDVSQLHTLSPAQLGEEKKKLHTFLKSYEKAFQRDHNRQVTRQEDIAPVSLEYARYKQVKQLLSERSSPAAGNK